MGCGLTRVESQTAQHKWYGEHQGSPHSIEQVVVGRRHDAIAHVEPRDLPLARVEAPLESGVESDRAGGAAVHRGDHLHLLGRDSITARECPAVIPAARATRVSAKSRRSHCS